MGDRERAEALEDANKLFGLNVKNEDELREKLEDGQLLCNKIFELYPPSKRRINTSKLAFKKMENIGFYLEAVKAYGIPDQYCFQTVDLYEGTNMKQVVLHLSQVYRKAKKDQKA